MESKTYTYESEAIEVTYDVKRCIHAAACVRALPAVFDTERRPWIDPEKASADAVAEAVHQCPTGALHYTRKDEQSAEPIPTTNTITLVPNGPLQFHGKLQLVDPEGTVLLEDTRMAVCRCGQSNNMPLCDGSHEDGDFNDAGEVPVNMTRADDLPDNTSALQIVWEEGSPATIKGPFRLEGADGSTSRHTRKAYLCRCGQSGTKPFCDGSHTAAGFST